MRLVKKDYQNNKIRQIKYFTVIILEYVRSTHEYKVLMSTVHKSTQYALETLMIRLDSVKASTLNAQRLLGKASKKLHDTNKGRFEY